MALPAFLAICPASSAQWRRVAFLNKTITRRRHILDLTMNKNDDIKRLHEVKISLTEREYLALCKTAEMHDRKTSDMGRVLIRERMFGILGAAPCECNEIPSPNQS
jgi:hypothetical protein